MSGGMPYADFLNAVIDDGLEEVKEAYGHPSKSFKLTGAIAGFHECRDKTPEQMLLLLEEAKSTRHRKHMEAAIDYWHWRLRELQIEFTLNVVSAASHYNGGPSYIPPTFRGLQKAIDILGVKQC